MDCEAFDKIVLDRIFQELDELAAGAAQRHVAHCSRCRGIEAGLKATREVATFPAVELRVPVAERVLLLERSIRRQLPVRHRLGSALRFLGGYAMRPQVTMAAVLLIMIGSSLFLVRSHPSEHDLIQITERGVPERDPVMASPPPSTRVAAAWLDRDKAARERRSPEEAAQEPDASASRNLDSQKELESALSAFHRGHYQEAQTIAEHLIASGSPATAAAALLAAQALRKSSGCQAALARLEALRVRHGKTEVGEEAAYHAAECQLELGHSDRAREIFTELRRSARWGGRANERLRSLSPAPDTKPTEMAQPPPSASPGVVPSSEPQ